jgi:hypothetical protein
VLFLSILRAACTIMSHVRYPLGPDDRVHLLCWLTCGFLGACYLDGAWPDVPFQVRAAHRWLDRHHRAADWLETAKLSVLAQALAARLAASLEKDARKCGIERVLEGEELDYGSALVQRVYDECRVKLGVRKLPE